MAQSLRSECRQRSIDLLMRASHRAGFVASPSFDHYGAIWSRDAALACIGAAHSYEAGLLVTSANTLRTMARLATARGQVMDAYWPDGDYWDWGEAGTTDATAWFVIALEAHVAATGDVALALELWPAAAAALTWLGYQDATGSGLIESPAGGDWMDSSLKRSGRVFHVNTLYWAAIGAANRLAMLVGESPLADQDTVGDSIDLLFWPRPGADLSDLLTTGSRGVAFPHPLAAGEYARLANPDRRHYLAAVAYGRFTDRCDVLAHLLAVSWNLVDEGRAGRIMALLDERSVAEPYPTRVWPEPFQHGDPDGLVDPVADAAQNVRWRNPPHAYHNAGAWPYVGAVHVVALSAVGRHADAADLLERVAGANQLGHWGFHEWIHGATGEPSGAPDQSWNAGAYLWADAVLRDAAIT